MKKAHRLVMCYQIEVPGAGRPDNYRGRHSRKSARG